MATLYRKYRPQKFSELFGQNHIKVTLEHEIESDKIAHAYLFCGPRAIGKTTIARVFAKAINCQKRKSGEHEPCNECSICREITTGRSLDVIEIDAASHTGVDNVRENIIATSRIAPTRAQYRVFIIDEVHMLSTPAFNALLKIIEEPPEKVVFILCTTEVHKVPTTIISRCQRFDFKRLNISEIVHKLQFIVSGENIKIDKEILRAIAQQSEGHMRDAESLLGQVVAIGGKEVTREEADLVIPRSDLGEAVRLIDYLGKKDAGSAIILVNKLLNEGVNLKRFIGDFIEIARKITLYKVNAALAEKLSLEYSENIEIQINNAGRNLSLNQVIAIMEKFIEAREDLKTSFIVQLPIEVAILELCTSAPAPAPVSVPPAANTAPAPAASAPQPFVVASGQSAKLTKEHIVAKWHEVLAKVKKYNHSLSFILRVCQPRDINGNQLCLAFKYKFHKDRISDLTIKRLVEKVLHEVYGTQLTIEAVIDENLAVNGYDTPPSEAQPDKAKTAGGAGESADKSAAAENGGKDDVVKNLLKTFGGKVIK